MPRMLPNIASLSPPSSYLPSITNQQDEVTPASLSAARVVAIVGPRSKFTQNEVDALKGFMEEGGSILITLGEGGESTNGLRFSRA